jgi:hypothetical protein
LFFLSIRILTAGHKKAVSFFVRDAARTMINIMRQAKTVVRTAPTFEGIFVMVTLTTTVVQWGRINGIAGFCGGHLD